AGCVAVGGACCDCFAALESWNRNESWLCLSRLLQCGFLQTHGSDFCDESHRHPFAESVLFGRGLKLLLVLLFDAIVLEVTLPLVSAAIFDGAIYACRHSDLCYFTLCGRHRAFPFAQDAVMCAASSFIRR